MTTPIETAVEAAHGAHLFRSLFVHAFELMDQVQRYQGCKAGEHPGYKILILSNLPDVPPADLARHRVYADESALPHLRKACDAWLRRDRARRCVDPAGLKRTCGKGGEPELGAIPEEVR